MQACVVLLETLSNQRYIFGTNRLRDNVGASEIIYALGHDILTQAWRNVFGNSAMDQPIEGGADAEVVVRASGSALVLVRERERGVALVRAVTSMVLQSYPGCDVCGVVGEPVKWTKDSLAEATRRVHEQLEAVRAVRPAAARFLRLPVVAPCARSGYPAADMDQPPTAEEAPQPISAPVQAKARAANAFLKRLRRSFPGLRFAADVNALEEILQGEDRRWIAVIHADGNGMGEMLQRFPQRMGLVAPATNREYIDTYRKLSQALDSCGHQALQAALEHVGGASTAPLPVVPLIVGGDDLTLIADGAAALPLTACYLAAFEELSGSATFADGILRRVAQATLGVPRLGACAGVAVIKPHFPFHAAYEIAEELAKSAKRVKTAIQHPQRGQGLYPSTALDFQVVHDASPGSLGRMRASWEGPGWVGTARPYVVTPMERLQQGDCPAAPASCQWAARRQWTVLQQAVAALGQQRDGVPLLPASALHHLRADILTDPEAAERRWALLWRGAQEDPPLRAALAQLAGVGQPSEAPPPLWWTEITPPDGEPQRCTALLDALEAAGVQGAR